jgi:cell wall-associated NlpC family hydrolase
MVSRAVHALPVVLCLLPSPASAEDVVDLAASLIGRPYVWGAEGPNAFDCSGLTQYVFSEFGVELPRRAADQSAVGQSIGRGLRRGDLVFLHPTSAVPS